MHTIHVFIFGLLCAPSCSCCRLGNLKIASCLLCGTLLHRIMPTLWHPLALACGSEIPKSPLTGINEIKINMCFIHVTYIYLFHDISSWCFRWIFMWIWWGRGILVCNTWCCYRWYMIQWHIILLLLARMATLWFGMHVLKNNNMSWCYLIQRNPPPRGGFPFTVFPNREPGGRGPPSQNMYQLLGGESSSTGFLIREHSK